MVKQTTLLSQVMVESLAKAEEARFEFLTPELFFYYGVLQQKIVTDIWESNNIDVKKFRRELKRYIDTLERVPKDIEYKVMPSVRFAQMTASAHALAEKLNKSEIGLFEAIMATIYIPEPNVIKKILDKIATIDTEKLADAMFEPLFKEEAINDKLFELYSNSIKNERKEKRKKQRQQRVPGNGGNIVAGTLEDIISQIIEHAGGNNVGIEIGVTRIPIDISGHPMMSGSGQEQQEGEDGDAEPKESQEPWMQLVTKINGSYKNHNPLIGREEELARTIHILCKKERHNVLYIGEPGVGKTAMIYGLLEAFDTIEPYAPEHLRKAEVYQLDLTDLMAGANYRGELENRIKAIMEGASKHESVIIYIDDIHHLVGLGSGGNDNTDASSMMLPYMDMPNIRFIGTTSYKAFNQQILGHKALTRRFQTVDIKEPSVDETVAILESLLPLYEQFHGVKYRNKKDTARYAVEMSNKYITNRYQPEKSIDLLDESGAYRQAHPIMKPEGGAQAEKQWVDKKVIGEMIQKICNLSNIPDRDDEDETKRLSKLADNIKAKIFGQDEAVKQISEAILMSKAGLLDMQKPIASFLFVGQTGVGKTEIAKVLANELNVELVRFDMSEYTEKHTVAKLIGSPAGYVGYDDGGLLTDAIRKSPNCVLLLDEIEKAHSDIYNILLQIMDYASLTDNKGQKSDFRHVILIMTSNAGAQYAHQATVGFNGATAGSAMLSAVKKTFKPEFINRLSATVLFNDINEQMASLILQKKLGELSDRLKAKNITLNLTDASFKELLDKGFSPQYGAREIDRVLNSSLTPLLMHEILFGKLKKGGEAMIDFDGKELTVKKG
ncbi:MAG: AAA family ATPase [Bacteroidales bacterium]|nr:AAA family ATPase [Bacteroidales bacterium]MBQ5575178.1 AAA family ATPase [Bacteroidales bacterium]